MNKSLLFSIILLLSTSLVHAGQPAPEVTEEPLVYGKHIWFKSDILGTTTSMNIYLPSSFEKASREHTYPVIFANGGHGEEFFLTLSGVVKHLGELDRMPESIVVSLNHSGYYPDAYTNGMWGSRDKISAYGDPEVYVKHLQQELFPYLQKHYRASDYRALIGVSGSALFPLYSLTHIPELFDMYIFTTSHDMIGMRFDEEMDMVEHMVRTVESRPKLRTTLYFGVADDDVDRNDPERDEKYQRNLARLRQALRGITTPGFKSKVEIIPNERHYDVYIKAMLSAFEFEFPEKRWAKKFRELIAQQGDAMSNIEQHYRTLSKEYGFNVLPKADRWNSVNSLRTISRVLLQDDRIQESMSVAKRWAELRPKDASPYYRLAQAHEKAQRFQSAIEAIDMALSLVTTEQGRLTESLEAMRADITAKQK